MTYADGSTYSGEYEHGLRHGRGVLTHQSGFKYDGQWMNGKMHGTARMTAARLPSGLVMQPEEVVHLRLAMQPPAAYRCMSILQTKKKLSPLPLPLRRLFLSQMAHLIRLLKAT